MTKQPIKPVKNKAATVKVAKHEYEPEIETVQDEPIEEQTAEIPAEVVDVIDVPCVLPHHQDSGSVDWDMVNDCVDILAQRKPGIENLDSNEQQAICRHLYQHFKEADLPIPDQIAALA